jgi:hypothetical protein
MLKQTLNRVFQKEIYNVIPNITVWWVLWKPLHLMAYRLSIVQDVMDSLYAFKCKYFLNTHHTVTFGIPL